MKPAPIVRPVRGSSSYAVSIVAGRFPDAPKVRPQSKTNVAGALRICASECAAKMFAYVYGFVIRSTLTGDA